MRWRHFEPGWLFAGEEVADAAELVTTGSSARTPVISVNDEHTIHSAHELIPIIAEQDQE